MKGKKGISIVGIFQKVISKGRKPNKILVEQGSEFKNYLFKRFVKNDNVEMYSSQNERKSVVSGRFNRAKILTRITTISKNVYFDVLDDIFKNYNNTVRRTIKIELLKLTLMKKILVLKLVKKLMELFMRKNWKSLIKKNSEYDSSYDRI